MNKMVYFLSIFVVAIMVVNNPLTDHYISTIKVNTMEVAKEQDPLYFEIEQNADKHYIPPIDAKIDRVWKAIPGYNGLEVDINASYNKMKKSGNYNEQRLVFNQVIPKTHLNDLPPSPIYKGNQEKPMVSFIINVAWGNEYLLDMLATLKEHSISATFFLEGRWVQKNPELAKMISDAGHEVGNHSYTHPDMQKLSDTLIRQEITKTNEVIEATTGKKAKWFAPPSGSYKDSVVEIAAEEKLGTIMWSVDTIDWQKPAPSVLINRVMGKVHNGAIILMHPTASTAQSLDQLIIQIKKENLQIDTISELFKEERILTASLKKSK